MRNDRGVGVSACGRIGECGRRRLIGAICKKEGKRKTRTESTVGTDCDVLSRRADTAPQGLINPEKTSSVRASFCSMKTACLAYIKQRSEIRVIQSLICSYGESVRHAGNVITKNPCSCAAVLFQANNSIEAFRHKARAIILRFGCI
jgi:hypothetical protein